VRIRFYFDEDAMDADLVDALRARGVDVETAYEAGMLEREDREQLHYATEQGRVVFTFNVGHFSRLHSELLAGEGSHAGIVVCAQQRYTIGEQMRRLLELVAGKSAEDMRDQLEFLGGSR
jgi:hypothetical protein